MFTRGEAAKFAGLAFNNITSLTSREQLVANGERAANSEGADRVGWMRFSPEDVAAIAVQAAFMAQLGVDGGTDPTSACKIVSPHRAAIEAALDAPPGAPDLWIGYVGFVGDEGEGTGGFHVAGDLSTVTLRVLAAAADPLLGRATRQTLVNVSTVIADARRRAAAQGVDL